MAGERMRRVNEAVREVLGTVVSGEIQDPRVGFVTVTGVDVSPDLRHANVYLSVLGSAEERESTLAGLEAGRGYLQRRIAAELRLKRTPALRFRFDESVERGVRISALLDGSDDGET